MLSSQALERTTCSFRNGYHHGYDQRELNVPDNGIAGIMDDRMGLEPVKPFADFDYKQGYAAGLNDKLWSAHRFSGGPHPSTNALWRELHNKAA